jgi:hypothetical protein
VSFFEKCVKKFFSLKKRRKDVFLVLSSNQKLSIYLESAQQKDTFKKKL